MDCILNGRHTETHAHTRTRANVLPCMGCATSSGDMNARVYAHHRERRNCAHTGSLEPHTHNVHDRSVLARTPVCRQPHLNVCQRYHLIILHPAPSAFDGSQTKSHTRLRSHACGFCDITGRALRQPCLYVQRHHRSGVETTMPVGLSTSQVGR